MHRSTATEYNAQLWWCHSWCAKHDVQVCKTQKESGSIQWFSIHKKYESIRTAYAASLSKDKQTIISQPTRYILQISFLGLCPLLIAWKISLISLCDFYISLMQQLTQVLLFLRKACMLIFFSQIGHYWI